MSRTIDNPLLVVAIDIGTTGSGYAVSFQHSSRRDGAREMFFRTFNNGGLQSSKTATTILFNPAKEFVAFGDAAEERFAELEYSEKHNAWYYFQNFKMLLHDKNDLNRNTLLKDHEDKEMIAMTIFTMSIKYLKDCFLEDMHHKVDYLCPDDILWVITVPGIWNDAAKQFMREAAQNAGIKGDQLLIALDTEAAMMFFKSVPPYWETAEPVPGTKVVVIDDGGGIVDTSVFKIEDDGTFRQIHMTSGGGWGCIQVDWAFTQLLIKIVGANVFLRFKNDYSSDYLELCREMEINKRNFDPDKKYDIRLRLPKFLIDIYEEMSGETLRDTINQTSYGNKIALIQQKVLIRPEVMTSLFEPLIRDLIAHMHGLFREPNVQDTKVIFMVGGFSNARVLQKAVRREFPDKTVIVPREPENVAVIGAVYYGFQPSAISARISRFTYGIEVINDFKPSDPPSKMKLFGGKEHCIDVFSKHVEIGETLMAGQPKPELRYFPVTDDQTRLDLCLYRSTNRNPLFVTDSGCQYIGKLMVDAPKVNGKTSIKYGIWVKLVFEETEIKVEARNEITGQLTSATFNFLDESKQTQK